MHPIRNNLKINSKFNPFNNGFDEDFVIKEIKRLSKKNNLDALDEKLIITMVSTVFLHPFFNDTYDYLKHNIFESNLSVSEIFRYCISFINRQIMLVEKNIRDEYLKNNEHDYTEFHKYQIDSSDPTIGKINARLALESTLDSLHVLFNYANYFRNKLPEKQTNFNDITSIEKIKRLNLFSSFYYILKTEYDQGVWNGGYVHFNKEKNTFIIRYISQELLVLKKIGSYRLNRNAFGFYLTGKELAENEGEDSIRALFRKNKTEKKIDEVLINNGYITYKLVDGIDKDEFNWELKNKSEFLSYYDFIENINLPELDSLTLNDIIILFDTLQHLLRKSSENLVDNSEVYTLNDFEKFPYRIKVNDLKNYLGLRTKYSTIQIEQFLELLCNKNGKRINFWDYPLLKENDDYLIPLISAIHPISTVLADRWLEDGGFNLDKRGDYFENYIKKNIREDLQTKGYEFKVPDDSIFKLWDTRFEEIDLIINLKYVCIIAEIKCIKLPMEPRDEHNALQRIEEAARQVKRKSQFIIDNKDHFAEKIGGIEEKEIINLIITNYPTFSGYQIDDIPVVDFFLIESYIGSGKITNMKITSEEGKTLDKEVESEIILYNDEKEFCLNFKSQMDNPVQIEQLKGNFEIKLNKISLDGMEYDIYVESAEFKD